MLECKLCGKKFTKLAKSHITPLGFFTGVESKAVLRSVGQSGGRKLQSAIYDREILCRTCEKDIMGPLDDYGIKIYRDKENARKVKFKNGKASVHIWDNIDSRKIRAFIASILWRISVSKQKEINGVTIGHANVRKIKNDLRRKNASFEYIDSVACFLTNKVHQGFFVPYRRKFHPRDLRRDKVSSKGMVIAFPNIVIFASFGIRRHPYRGDVVKHFGTQS